MAQITSLSPLGTPGATQVFVPKTAAIVLEFPCNISSTVETVQGMAASLDLIKDITSIVDTVKGISSQIDCDH